MTKELRPWPALWALVLGFFMILVDTTIVSVANPAIMEGLGTDINSVIWVTSAYLLAFAVPLLITGRLGDRFGPKNLYLIGLVVFTLSSLWCGLSGTIEMLILARVFQGLGAAMLTPQTMAVITRMFPPDRRGAAMGVWGSVAGVATLAGPILGGLLVDGFGWEWIFFVNVPVGVIAFVLAVRLVPRLTTHSHRFDWLGVVLSGVGMFLLVFGIQEGGDLDWDWRVWLLIGGGVVVLAAFVGWQAVMRGEPLIPLSLFRDRNFSLTNAAITTVGFAVVSMSLPLMFFLQLVFGFSPTQSALMLVPMGVITGILSPFVGRVVDRVNPKYVAVTGLVFFTLGMGWYAFMLSPDIAWGWLLLPACLLGLANACVWSPLSSTVTYNLPRSQAGAGSGVYNTTRQVGSVLGSAAIAALMTARITANLPEGAGAHAGSSAQDFQGGLPEFLHAGFATAMGESLLLPAALTLVGAIIVMFFEPRRANTVWAQTGSTSAVEAPEGPDAGAPASAEEPPAAAEPSATGARVTGATPAVE